ncbi:MAG: 50S ribosomal protein L25 [Candidatus Margulisbacteria bacterium]|nr:50S ribosomal protein L25 [Candidatus Margulisiibacteriota bacterium]
MAKKVNLNAGIREEVGKKVKNLRLKGIVPGIFYGKGNKNINLEINEKDLKKALSTEAGFNVIINLTIKDAKGEQNESVIPQDVQVNPITDKVEHVDFRKIDLKEKITTKVPVHLVGIAPGVKLGGILVHQLHEVEIRCLPTDIPAHIDIDITSLADIGAVIKVGEIKFPEKVEALHLHPEQTAVAVLAPKKEEEVVAAPLEASAEPEVIGKGKVEGEEGAEAGTGEKAEKGKEAEAKKSGAEEKKTESKKA